MKAVVLVGGEGTRLRPLTETVPKPLLPMVDRPFLHHVLDHLADHGVHERRAVVAVPRGDVRPVHRRATGRRRRSTWITESQPLGTGGAIANALDRLGDDPFLVLNGDILTDLDLTAHGRVPPRARRRGHHLARRTVEDARPYGLVDVDRQRPRARVPREAGRPASRAT